jgi:hypothetical protein
VDYATKSRNRKGHEPVKTGGARLRIGQERFAEDLAFLKDMVGCAIASAEPVSTVFHVDEGWERLMRCEHSSVYLFGDFTPWVTARRAQWHCRPCLPIKSVSSANTF